MGGGDGDVRGVAAPDRIPLRQNAHADIHADASAHQPIPAGAGALIVDATVFPPRFALRRRLPSPQEPATTRSTPIRAWTSWQAVL
jgi:hypothetical protein